VTAIERSASRMAYQVDELLDVARLQMGQDLALRIEPVDLVALARESAVEFDQRATDHVVRFEGKVTEVIAEVDRLRIERVVANLLANAVKYSPKGGEIVVTVTVEDGEAVLSVRDRGIGIPAPDLPRIFEPFHRGANTAATAGTGIGLAGAKRIVEHHGGRIAVESTEGEGSTFTVRLPLAPQRGRTAT
jgi:signal transduction histidine kinase